MVTERKMKSTKPKLASILLSIAAAPMNVLVESTPGLIESTAADSSRIVGGGTARANDYPYFGKQEILIKSYLAAQFYIHCIDQIQPI